MTYARPSGTAPAADSSLTPKTAVSTAIGQHTFKTCSWADGPQPSGDDVWPREPALIACSGGHSHSHSTRRYWTEPDRTDQKRPPNLTCPDPTGPQGAEDGQSSPKQRQ